MERDENALSLMQAGPYRCWLTLLGPDEASEFDDVARAAGLEPLGKRWHEVDRPTAEAFLTSLLHQSLAYDVELMPEKTATWLAHGFLAAVGQYGTRFATNSPGLPGDSPFGWEPATDHTFDAGVVAIGTNGAALYWVADED